MTVELPFDVRDITTFWENISWGIIYMAIKKYADLLSSLAEAVYLFILADSDGHGNVWLTEDDRNSPTEVRLIYDDQFPLTVSQALKKFLKHSEVYLKARHEASKTCTGAENETWCVLMVYRDALLNKYENISMLKYLRTL